MCGIAIQAPVPLRHRLPISSSLLQRRIGQNRRSSAKSLSAFAAYPTTLGASFADMQTVVFGM
jgi:hypothetical protein